VCVEIKKEGERNKAHTIEQNGRTGIKSKAT
jgi:hypothetical protein